MAYKLNRGEFKTWKELLDLAGRALSCDEFVVVSGCGSQGEKKCEECDSLDTCCLTSCRGEEKAFCLNCLYDLAENRKRLGEGIEDQYYCQCRDEDDAAQYAINSKEEAEAEYRRNPMIR